MLRCASLLALLTALWPPPTALGQAPPTLEARARIRIWGEGLDDEGVDGRLYLVDGDTLRVFADSLPLAIPIASLRRLDVSLGRDPVLMIGGPLLGAMAGAVIGPALLGESLVCRLEVVEERECAGETSDALIGAATGFATMLFLTGIFVEERWIGYPLDQLAVLPRRDGIALVARLRF